MFGRVQKLIDGTPGPTPWYWTTFPRFDAGDRTWSWRPEPRDVELGSWPVLQSDWDEAPRFAPGAYDYVVDAGAGHMLVWRATLSGSVELRIHRVEALAPVELRQTSWRKRDTVAQAEVERVRIPRLPAGAHGGFAASTGVALDELLFLAHRPTSTDEAPALAIYAWRPRSGEVTVLPQTWFTGAAYDLGYQWVTRVVRDAKTGRIVGDGIRLSAFELDDDGLKVRRWFRPMRV